MERSQLFDLMGELKLFGMKAAFDEIMATAVKRQHEPQRIIGDLLNAEISEKQARSIKYQLTIAKLPLAKDLDDFQFEHTPINETLVNELASGGFIAQQRNAVLVGGTGTGKTHLAIAIARSCIRSGARGRFYNVVDLVNRLETEARNARHGRLADHLTRVDFVILDELGYLPFAQSGGHSCSTSSAASTSAPRSSSPPTSPSVNGRASSRSRRFHDASFLERLVCRTRARS
jgi:DNA replication protein DnaC